MDWQRIEVGQKALTVGLHGALVTSRIKLMRETWKKGRGGGGGIVRDIAWVHQRWRVNGGYLSMQDRPDERLQKSLRLNLQLLSDEGTKAF